MTTAKTLYKNMACWKSLALIIAICFMISVPPLSAQQDDEQGYDDQQQQEQTKDFSDQDLEKFASAKGKLDGIRDEYSAELEQVNDAEEAQKLQNKYGQKMIEEIRAEDMTVEKYNEISQAMQSDPELQEKIQQISD
ncbi:MAG: DUF4168 domain-containing protein [Desulfobacteraceae bacterium]